MAPESMKKSCAVVMAALLVVSPLPLRAGDLNAEVNNMFNNLGAIGNYTAPGAFRGQTSNPYPAGSFFMRSPNKVYSSLRFSSRAPRPGAAASTCSAVRSRTSRRPSSRTC